MVVLAKLHTFKRIEYRSSHRFFRLYICVKRKSVFALLFPLYFICWFFFCPIRLVYTRIPRVQWRTMAFKHMQNTEVYCNRIRLTLTLCASVLYACTSERNRYRFDTEQRAISFTSSTLTNGLLCYYYYICCFCYFIHRRFFLLFYSVLFSVRFPFTFIFLLHHRIGLCVKLLK